MINKRSRAMAEINLVVCSGVIILSFLIQLKTFYLNPISLPTSCVFSEYQTDDEKFNFMDCISCFSFADKMLLQGAIQGSILLSLPPFKQPQKFIAQVYSQQQCYQYQCPQLRFGDDFSYTDHKQTLSNLAFKRNQNYKFFRSIPKLKRILYLLMGYFDVDQENKDQLLLTMPQISNKRISAHSFFIRYRYFSPQIPNILPNMKFHYFAISLEYRLILCLLLILNVASLLRVMNQCGNLIPKIIILFLSLAFLNDLFLGFASLISNYILFSYYGEIKKIYALGIIVLYSAILFLNWIGFSQLLLLLFNTSVASFFLTLETEKKNQKNRLFMTALSIAFGVCFIAWLYGITYFNQFAVYYILTLKSYVRDNWTTISLEDSQTEQEPE